MSLFRSATPKGVGVTQPAEWQGCLGIIEVSTMKSKVRGKCYVFRRKSNVAGNSGFSSMSGTAFRSGV